MSRSTTKLSNDDNNTPDSSRRPSSDFVSNHAADNLAFGEELIKKLSHSENKIIKSLGEKLNSISLETDPKEYQSKIVEAIGLQYADAYIKERKLEGSLFSSTKKHGALKILDDAIKEFNKTHTDSPFLKYGDYVPKSKQSHLDYRLFTALGDNKVMAEALFNHTIQALSDRNKDQFVNCLKILVRSNYGGRANFDDIIRIRLGNDLGDKDSNLTIRDTLDQAKEKELVDYYNRAIRNPKLLEGIGNYVLKEYRKIEEQKLHEEKTITPPANSPRLSK